MRDEDQASAVRGGGMPSDLGRLLLRAHRDFGARALAQLRARGVADLGLAHTALLATLDPAGGGTSVTLLAERAAMTKQAIGELAIDLERGGYVTRAPDPADRRATIVTITAAGRRALRAAPCAPRWRRSARWRPTTPRPSARDASQRCTRLWSCSLTDRDRMASLACEQAWIG